MRVEVFTEERKFRKVVIVFRQTLNYLGKLFGLEGKQVEIYVVGDRLMKKNVLAYPAPKNFPRPDLKGRQPLGEIYLNLQYMRQRRQNHLHLLIHGFLHLLGYSHQRKDDRIKMEAKESELFRAVHKS